MREHLHEHGRVRAIKISNHGGIFLLRTVHLLTRDIDGGTGIAMVFPRKFNGNWSSPGALMV
jgi:hypothetical protein